MSQQTWSKGEIGEHLLLLGTDRIEVLPLTLKWLPLCVKVRKLNRSSEFPMLSPTITSPVEAM